MYFKVSTVFVLPHRHVSIMFHCGDSVSFRSDSDDLKVASPVFLWPRSWYCLIGVGGEQQSESLYLNLAFCQIRECLPWLPWYGESCLCRRSQILQKFSVDASYVSWGGGWVEVVGGEGDVALKHCVYEAVNQHHLSHASGAKIVHGSGRIIKRATQIVIKSGPRVIIRAWEIGSKGGALGGDVLLTNKGRLALLYDTGVSNALHKRHRSKLWWAGWLPAHAWNASGNPPIVSMKLCYKRIVSLSLAFKLSMRGSSRDLCQRSRGHRP